MNASPNATPEPRRRGPLARTEVPAGPEHRCEHALTSLRIDHGLVVQKRRAAADAGEAPPRLREAARRRDVGRVRLQAAAVALGEPARGHRPAPGHPGPARQTVAVEHRDAGRRHQVDADRPARQGREYEAPRRGAGTGGACGSCDGRRRARPDARPGPRRPERGHLGGRGRRCRRSARASCPERQAVRERDGHGDLRSTRAGRAVAGADRRCHSGCTRERRRPRRR